MPAGATVTPCLQSYSGISGRSRRATGTMTMKMRMWICALASLMLAACATTGAPGRRVTQDEYAERYNADYDSAKVAAVEQWAQARGATVRWINYPRKKPSGS